MTSANIKTTIMAAHDDRVRHRDVEESDIDIRAGSLRMDDAIDHVRTHDSGCGARRPAWRSPFCKSTAALAVTAEGRRDYDPTLRKSRRLAPRTHLIDALVGELVGTLVAGVARVPLTHTHVMSCLAT